MIRPALAVFAGLVCGMIGHRQARRLREEGTNLRSLEQLLRRLALLLREGRRKRKMRCFSEKKCKFILHFPAAYGILSWREKGGPLPPVSRNVRGYREMAA